MRSMAEGSKSLMPASLGLEYSCSAVATDSWRCLSSSDKGWFVDDELGRGASLRLRLIDQVSASESVGRAADVAG